MSTKPIYMCSTLNFGLLDNHGNPGGVGIVFLYKPGTDNLNFCLCVYGYATPKEMMKKFLFFSVS